MNLRSEVTTVDQKGIRSLVLDILNNPKLYADKLLFIWQAEWLDGIQQAEVMHANREFNEGKTREDWSYFRSITVIGEATHLKAPHDWGTQAGFVVSTRTMPIEEYLAQVRRLWAENSSNLPMIVYMPYKYKAMELPGEQFLFEPDFEQWASEWADPLIPDFIRGNGDPEGITYRWYNRYNDPDRGCSTPNVWLATNSYLNGFVKLTRDYRKDYGIRDLSEEQIRSAFHAGMKASGGHISNDVITDFVKHVTFSHRNLEKNNTDKNTN